MNFSNSDSKPVILFSARESVSFNSLAQKTRFARNKFFLAGAALAVVGATLIPATIYAWSPQPYCRSGQTVMVTYDETNHQYNTQAGDVAGECLHPSPLPSPVSSPSTSPDCVVTDLKGTLEHSDNHESGNPVKGHLENISDNPNCQGVLWVDIYGSKQKVHEGDGWLESQSFVSQQRIEVKKGQKDLSIEIPNQDFCWYQVDVIRNSDIKVPPRFNGTDMVDYAFIKDQDSCEASPVPIASAQGTVTINNTNNNTNNNTTNVTVVSPSSSPQVIAAAVTPATELPKTGLPLAGLALGGLAPVGMKLKKFVSTKEVLSANFIWEKRQLEK